MWSGEQPTDDDDNNDDDDKRQFMIAKAFFDESGMSQNSKTLNWNKVA